MKLIIDVGNTAVKIAIYKDEEQISFRRIAHQELPTQLLEILQTYSVQHTILSSVGHLSREHQNFINTLPKPVFLNSDTKVPFRNLYATPKTLGVDRIALAGAATAKFPMQNVLVIDAGTCITYDFISADSEYLGGAIAPGIMSRYKSLHDYTDKLPLLDKKNINYFIGNSTETCIHSGVVNGVVCEIEGVITQYSEVYKKLTVVLTGGDAEFLAKQLKSSIFANSNFLINSLHQLFLYNSKK